MTGSLEQNYRYSWDSTSVSIKLVNTHRNLTPEELQEAQSIFRAAEEFVARLHSDGTLRQEAF